MFFDRISNTMFHAKFSKIIGISIKTTPTSILDKFKLAQLMCGNCPAYNKRWACPPFEMQTKDIVPNKKFANLVAIKIKPTQKNISPKKIIDQARSFLDELFYEFESSNSNHILLLAGSCICSLAENCPKQKNIPCVKKEKMRYSLEALGYDVMKISEELLNIKILWQTDVQPEYFTLVYCICSDSDISCYLKEHLQNI